MRVLVTGGAGFIGSHLSEALIARGDEVAILDSFHPFYPRASKERNLAPLRTAPGFGGLFEVDVRDRDGVARVLREFHPNAVAHLAARGGVRPSIADPEAYVDTNVNGTAVMLAAAVRAGVERFVFASSSTVYGARPREPFHEDLAADRPISPYGASKRSGELLCHTTWVNQQMPCTCLRFFTVYGPRQRPDLGIHIFTRKALDDETIEIFGDGSIERDFTFITDTVDGIVRALDRADGFHVYNLGRGKPVTLIETLDALERALGIPVKRRFGDPVNGDLPRTWASIDRARKELGYEPTVELAQGLDAFVAWIREEERGCGSS